MYLLKTVNELHETPSFITTEDPKLKTWNVSNKPTIFIKLKDARKLRKRILESKAFEDIDVYKLTRMKTE